MEIKGGEDTIWVVSSAVLAGTRNTQPYRWPGREETSTEAAVQPISSTASDIFHYIPQESVYPVRGKEACCITKQALFKNK